ncbi:aspartate aminotransferase family protein [Geodermatophilus sp. SYSU D01186]
MTALPAPADRVFRLVRDHLAPPLALLGRIAGSGAVESEAQGCSVTLSDGRRMLDFGSYAVTLLGHRHPDVVAAVHAQLDRMPTATRTLGNPVLAEAAAAVAGYVGLPRVWFGCNGTDAVEAALKLARLASGRSRVLAVTGGYHGKTLGSLAATHHPRYRGGLEQVLGPVTHLDPADPDAADRALAAGDVAALLVEPVQGENGVVPLPVPVLRRWAGAVRTGGGFVVADEIQCGLRRCGERSVAVADGIPVDAVLLGKPLGGGVVPLSALVCTDDLHRPLAEDPSRHTATFSGHPLSCAAVPPTLRAIEAAAPRLPDLERRLSDGLADLARRHPGAVTTVRGRGLLWGLDLSSPAVAGAALVDALERGLLISPCLGRPTTLRLLPPLVARPADVDTALSVLDDVLPA